MSLLTAVAPVTTHNGTYQNGVAHGNQLLGLVRSDLQLVEAKMKSFDSALFAPLANAFLDLIGSGGKRLRPALALMAGGVTGAVAQPAYERVIALAAAVEMLHTATLVHDDVIDGAMLRRGAPTLNATWNGGSTVLAGNYMFGAAALFSAQTQNLRVIRLFSDTLKIIVDGELRQLRDRYNYEQEKSAYYQRIYAKTASLFCAATEGAAILSGCSEPEIKRLRDARTAKLWPFETGWKPLAGADLADVDAVFAEIYPSMYAAKPNPGEIKDQAQVRGACERFNALDEKGQLCALFGPAKEDARRETVEREEGWILGAPC